MLLKRESRAPGGEIDAGHETHTIILYFIHRVCERIANKTCQPHTPFTGGENLHLKARAA